MLDMFLINGQARAHEEKTTKEMISTQKQWQSDGRKDIIAAEAAANKEYERSQLVESKIKSEQFRAVTSSCLCFFLLKL